MTDKAYQIYWNYFLAIENDLEKISRYIEISERNFCTYSVELLRTYLACCSEVDNILKQICYKSIKGQVNYSVMPQKYKPSVLSHKTLFF
jgi:phage-related protein